MTEISKNYTPEQTTELINLYTELGNEGIEEIAKTINKPIKSVIAKLVKEGVYIAKPKNMSRRTSASKKELLNELENIVGFDTAGLTNSTKESLTLLLRFLKESSLRD